MTNTILAYLDAGSASAIVTLILGGIAGIGVAFKARWRQLLVTLRIKKPLEDETPAAAPAESHGAVRVQEPAEEPVEPARR